MGEGLVGVGLRGIAGEMVYSPPGPPQAHPPPFSPRPPSYLPHLVLLTGPTGEEPRTRSCSTPPSVDLSNSRPEGVK